MSQQFSFNGQVIDRMIILIRHGRPVAVDPNKVRGVAEKLPLSSTGKSEIRALGKAFSGFSKRHGIQVARAYSSSATRATETRKIFIRSAGITPQIMPPSKSLLEMSKKGWEGQVRSAVYTPEALEQSWTDWHFRHGLGETAFEAGQRWLRELKRITNRRPLTRLPYVDLVFGHEGVTAFGLHLRLGSQPPLKECAAYSARTGTGLILVGRGNAWYVAAERLVA